VKKFKIIAVLPARMNSSRYPGKPLIEISGIPMIEHVRRRVLKCNYFDRVIVATCDKKIFNAIKNYGGDVVMTSNKHKMASDRVAEVVKLIDCTHVVNIQGDELLVVPREINKLIRNIKKNQNIDFWNAIAPINNKLELKDRNVVKCVISNSSNLLFCTRYVNEGGNYKNIQIVYSVLGILAFSKKGILAFSNLKRTSIEQRDSIDQMRIIQNDIILKGIKFKMAYPGINTKDEEMNVRKILRNDQLQKKILKSII
tara:strand:- start:464 stop:1231 length:768 start_codon:yes stop_codon:yes gene_type:complete